MIVERCVIPAERKVEFQKVEIPDREPKENELLLETAYSLVSPGTETAVYTALDPQVHGGWCAYPWVSGYTTVGRVLKAGKNRWGYKAGDTVLSSGPHASYCWINTEGDVTAAVPPGM